MRDEPEGTQEEEAPESFLEAIVAMTEDEDEFPSLLLFFPVIAQELVAVHIVSCFETAGSPWNLLTVELGGDYGKTPENKVSVVAAIAQMPKNNLNVLARTVPVTVGFHTTRDVPLDIAARFFSTIQIALQPKILYEKLPGIAATEELSVDIIEILELGESQNVDENGRVFNKTVSISMKYKPQDLETP